MYIQEILNAPEGHTLEFKKELPAREDLAKCICAFSNLSGGNIIVGIDPKTREITGFDRLKLFETQEYVKKLISELIEPLPVYFLKVASFNGKKLLIISIVSGNLKPYHLRDTDMLMGTFVRIGRHIQQATPKMIAELERLSAHVCYDATPAYDTVVEDINYALIEEYLSKREKNLSIPKGLVNYAFLEKNHLIVRERGKIYPSIATILCFSDKANDYFPHAKVKCKIYEYDDKSKLSDILTVSGPLIKQVEQVINFFKTVDIPRDILKELIINAIVHRDYSFTSDVITVSVFNDRIEVESPGYLPNGISLEDLEKGLSVCRNQTIYKIFSEMYSANNSVSGIQEANKRLNENGLKPLIFSSAAANFVATVLNEISEDFFTREELKILSFLEANDYINNTQCQKLLRVKGKQAQYILTKLVKKEKLVSIGEKKGRRYEIKPIT